MNKTIFPLLIINQWMFNNKTNYKTAVEYTCTWRFVVEGAGGGGGLWIWGEGNFYQL